MHSRLKVVGMGCMGDEKWNSRLYFTVSISIFFRACWTHLACPGLARWNVECSIYYEKGRITFIIRSIIWWLTVTQGLHARTTCDDWKVIKLCEISSNLFYFCRVFFLFFGGKKFSVYNFFRSPSQEDFSMTAIGEIMMMIRYLAHTTKSSHSRQTKWIYNKITDSEFSLLEFRRLCSERFNAISYVFMCFAGAKSLHRIMVFLLLNRCACTDHNRDAMTHRAWKPKNAILHVEIFCVCARMPFCVRSRKNYIEIFLRTRDGLE